MFDTLFENLTPGATYDGEVIATTEGISGQPKIISTFVVDPAPVNVDNGSFVSATSMTSVILEFDRATGVSDSYRVYLTPTNDPTNILQVKLV